MITNHFRAPFIYITLQNRLVMSLTEAELQFWSKFYKAHWEKVGREGSHEPPPSSLFSDQSCNPTGLLTPSREDHGAARPTRREGKPMGSSSRSTRAVDNSAEEFRQWLANIPKPAPDVFPRLNTLDAYIYWNDGLEYDWDRRSSRSEIRKQAYLFALDYSVVGKGEPVVAVLGDDSAPEGEPPRWSE